MNALPTAYVLDWSFWNAQWPGAKAVEDHFLRGQNAEPMELPSCRHVPSLLRRRLSLLMRMVLDSGLEALQRAGIDPAAVAKVLASRHGEIHTLLRLFESLAASEPLSPTAFSHSVHHSAVGYFGVTHGNTHPSRAVSSGQNSLAAGLLEAMGLLARDPETPVLLCLADEIFPPGFPGDAPPSADRLPRVLSLVLASQAPPTGGGKPRIAYAAHPAESSSSDLSMANLLPWLCGLSQNDLIQGAWQGSFAWSR